MRNFIEWCLNYWRENSVKLSVATVAAVLLLYRVGSIPVGASKKEAALIASLRAHKINYFYVWHNVVFLPYSVGIVILRYTHLYNLYALRGLAAVFGLASAIIFFYLIWRWYGGLIATLATGLFASSLWFLQASRLGGGLSLYSLALLAIILITFIKRNEKHESLKTVISVLALVLIIYIPGMVWFVLASLILNKDVIIDELRNLERWIKLVLPIISLVILSPLIWSAVHNINVLRQIFGVPSHLSLHEVSQNLYHFPLDVFIRSSSSSVFAIGHLPLMDIFSTTMVILGIYSLYKDMAYRTLIGLLIGFLGGWLLFSLGIVPAYVSLVILAILVAGGLHYLLDTWFTVFPRNPLARGVGVAFISLAVISVVWLHINQFYIAWPNTLVTISTYSQHI